MRKQWYIKPIAAFLTMAITVSNMAPAVVRAEDEALMQSETLLQQEEASVQPEEQSEDAAVQAEDSMADEQSVPDAEEASASPVRIGETGYQTLKEAVQAANAGDIIVLQQDIQLDECLLIEKNLTITADGTDRMVGRSDINKESLFEISSGAVLTLGSGAETGLLILDGGARWVKDVEVEDESNPEGKITKQQDVESPAEDGAYNAGWKSAMGLVWIRNGCLELSEDGVLQNNAVVNNGAAVMTNAGGASRINIRGTVRNNYAEKTGGAIYSNGYIDIFDTAVLAGNAAAGNGGAINNFGGGVVTVNGGIFSGNKAAQGGAAYTDGKFEIKNVSMTGNMAQNGGALCVASENDGRSLLFSGGTAADNQALEGADIYLIKENAKFRGNVTIGDVFLQPGMFLKVNGALNGSIGLTTSADPGESGVVVAQGAGYTMAESDAACIRSVSGLYSVSYKDAAAYLNYSPVVIDQQPATVERAEINETVKFSIQATVPAETAPSYQWYECADADGSDGKILDGENNAELQVTKSERGIYYYYCIVSAERASQVRSEVVSVKFADSTTADQPVITAQPEDVSIDLQKEGTLSVEAKVDDQGVLGYQWYRLDDPEGEDGTLIEGADEASYQVPSGESGTFYYYCIVTNTNESLENKVSSVRSRTASVLVTEAAVRLNEKPYSSLDDALAMLDGEKDGTLEIISDVTMSRTVTVSGGNLTVKAAEGSSPVIKLTAALNAEAFIVKSGTLTIEQITLDGGAVWAGAVHDVLKRGTNNRGRSVNSPLITMKGGTVNLVNGTVFQNNVAPWTAAGVVMNAGTLNIEGSQMNDCYGGSHGGVIYSNSADCKINVTGSKMLRNQARNSTGALCADLGTKVTIQDSEFANNYTAGRGGALFINGTLHISGNTDIHDNSAGANGGGILHISGNLIIEGGTIRNNRAAANGGGIASLGGTLQMTQGTIRGNTASSNGNGIYLESGVNVEENYLPDGVTDGVYSMKTLKLTLDGNGTGQTSEYTVRYMDLYDFPEIQRNGYEFLGWFTEPENGDQVVQGGRIRSKTAHTLYAHWNLTADNAITVSEQPVGGERYIEDEPSLVVNATAERGEPTYQWYLCGDENGTDPEVAGEGSQLTLPTDEGAIGTYYYYCVISAEGAVDVQTEIIKIELISRNHASVPRFTSEPEGGEMFAGDELELSAQAEVNDGGTISYQWYEGDTEDPAEASEIPDAQESAYTVRPSEAETKYYFVKAVNTKEDSSGSQVKSESFSSGAKVISHSRIQVEQLTADDEVLSRNYWNAYRVGTSGDVDGYITSVTSTYGSYGSNVPDNAFDGRFDTFWETNKGGVVNQFEMNFDKAVKLDRIVYATRQDWLAGRGYPTRLTVYSKNQQGEWEEAGVAVSEENRRYIMFRLPQTITSYGIRMDFTESTYNNWASASEVILLRDESTVLKGSALISGNAVPGSTLTVQPLLLTGPGAVGMSGLIDPSLTCQWQTSADGSIYTDIDGAEGQTYTVREEDRDQYLRAVIRDGSGRFTGSVVSAPYRGSFQVVLAGEPVIGSRLSPDVSYMNGEPVDYKYQWQKTDSDGSFVDIDHATDMEYTVRAADAGHKIRVAVSVGNYTVYSDESVIDVSALMTGAPQTGGTLKASLQGVAEESKLELSYRWQISEDKNEFADVQDAAEESYTIPEGMEEKYIRAVIHVKESGKDYTSEAWQILPADTVQSCDNDFVYLSDLRPDKLIYSHVGFGNLQYDRNTSGNRISLMVDGQKNYFMKGFGAHADATLIFDVSDYVTYYHYDRFIAYLGVDSAQGSTGNGVTFQVQTSVDGNQYTTVKTTGVLKGSSNAVPVDINLNGAKYLKIYVDTNGNAQADHSVLADARLASKTFKNETGTTDLFQTVEEYDSQIRAYEEAHKGSTHTELLDQDEYRKLVYQRSFVKAADYQMLKAYLYDDTYARTLEWFLNDMEALDLYMGGGAPDGSYANFVEALKNLYISNGSDMEDETNGHLYKKMIITAALTHSANVVYWADSSVKSDVVRRYGIYKKLYDADLLINNTFKNLSVEEMRWVFNNISADEEIEWLNYYVRYHTDRVNYEEITLDNFTPGPYHFIRYTMGFNYYQERFYSEENKAGWQQEYFLTNETANPKIEPYDFNITYEKNRPRLWIVWEAGAVCGGISKTGTNLLTAFGVPGVVIGQPGHAAYFQYSETADGKGKWDIYNDVSGWTLSEKGERMLNGWGNQKWKSAYNGSYVLLAQAAINEEGKYYRSQELVKLADVYSSDPEKQIEIYNEALDVLNLNLDAWEGLVNAYEAAGKGSEGLLELADRISEALTWYPLPMRDMLINLIRPKLDSESDKAVVNIYVQSALKRAQGATTANTLQPKYCITMANYLLGKTDYQVATFSFDGDKAGTVVLDDSFSGGNQLLISIDSGKNWISAGTVKEYKFTEKQLEQINAEDDIRVRLQGTENYYTIDITKGSSPSNIYNNDLENRMTGNVDGLEWKPADAQQTGWEDLRSDCVFEGNQKIMVRRKPAGTASASDAVEYAFTKDREDASRKYIPLSKISLEAYSSAETAKNGAAENILDGNIYTGWHTAWNGSDKDRYLTVKFDEPRYLTSIDYLPSGGNGTFQNVEVYTSMDAKAWTLAGTADGWLNNSEKKTLDLYAPVYTSYVMIKVTKGINGFASGRMLEFFEDTTVQDKTVERMELQSAPSRTTYMVGDEPDLSGLNVRAYYTDGTYSSMNSALLKFTPDVFREIGEQTVAVSYRMNDQVEPVNFRVTVEENTKTADSIEIAKAPDKNRYFAGDELDLTGLQVKAHYTDGSTGYLFEGQYSVDLTTLEQTGKEIPVTVSYNQGEQVLTAQFEIEVTKQVKEITVTKKPSKESYNLADTLETEGMEVEIIYTDDTREVLDPMEYTVESDGFSSTSGSKELNVVYNRRPEIRTTMDILVYPYITEGYMQFESHDGSNTAYVSGVADSGLPADGKVTIPAQVTAADKLNFTVTEIGSGAFAQKQDISSVVIPDTVRNIASGAFTGCMNLKEVYLTGYTDFTDFIVADDAFGPVNAEGAVQGTIYVVSEELKQQLEGKELTGLKNFLIVPVTAKMTEIHVTAPDKTEYHLGEPLDLKGFRVTAVLENGEELKLSDNLYTVSEYVSDRAGEQTLTVTAAGMDLSDSFTVTVTPAEPVIERQPESRSYDESESPEPLKVQASVSDAGQLRYQWYVSEDGDHFEKLDSETGAGCTVAAGETRYYYAEVTNNDAAGGKETAVTVKSHVAKITFGQYEARVSGTAYETLEQAIAAADGTDSKVTLIKNIVLDHTIRIDKDVTLEGFGIYRSSGFTSGYLLNISGGKVTLKNLIVDGGAVWSGSADPVLNRGTSNSGTNEATKQNAVSSKETLVLVSGGELKLAEGASLQNNSNTSNNYGASGGAARVSGGTLRIAGGQIVNNYSIPYGGAVLSLNSSKVILEKGRVAGNQATDSGGTFCVDGSSSFTIKDSGDINMPSVIEHNRGNANGGVIWLSNGSADLSGGIIRSNRANGSGGVVFISGSGTVSLGEVQISGNQAGGRGAGVDGNTGTVNIKGVPAITDSIYLRNGKLLNIRADLSFVPEKIPVEVQNYQSAGAQFGTADSPELARAAAGAFLVTGGELPVYAYNGGLYYGNPTIVKFTKDLPETTSVMAGRQLVLSVEAAVESADAAEPVYQWYRCSDAEGNGATPIAVSESGEPNVLSLGDCSEGVCYFYCEVSASNGKAETVRSAICEVTVTKFVPASRAIEKMNQL